MIVATSQDVILIGCCDCHPSACDTPRKECQSISADACAYGLTQVDGMPRTDFCLLYKTVSTTIIRALHYTTSGSGEPTYVYANDETDGTVKKKKIVGGSCTEVVDSTSYDLVESETTTPSGGGSPSSDFTTHQYSSSGSDGVCTGSNVYTDHLDPSNNETTDFPVCNDFSETPDSSWTYSGTGVYTRSGASSSYDSYEETITYSDPITASDLAGQISDKIAALEEGADWPDSGCVSSIISSKTYTIQDPPAPPADVDPDFVPELVCSQVSGVIKARYKIGIPEAWADFSGRHATWVTDHATWVAADPDTRGPEPIEPVERTVFECQWDEYFFPAEWEAWKAIKDEFDTTTADHEAWAACEALTPGECGDEPTISATPGTEPTAPSLVNHRSWSYGGTDEFSDWFEIAVPETEGQTRVVNMLVKCYHSTRLGVKPTASGEVYKP